MSRSFPIGSYLVLKTGIVDRIGAGSKIVRYNNALPEHKTRVKSEDCFIVSSLNYYLICN